MTLANLLPLLSPFLTKASTKPTPCPLKSDIALPIIAPALVAFIAIPGTDEVVSKSPALMAPFSVFTFTGTLPDKATGTAEAPSPSVPPIVNAGAVETIPSTEGSYLPSDFFTPALRDESRLTTSPIAIDLSLVEYISAKSAVLFVTSIKVMVASVFVGILPKVELTLEQSVYRTLLVDAGESRNAKVAVPSAPALEKNFPNEPST